MTTTSNIYAMVPILLLTYYYLLLMNYINNYPPIQQIKITQEKETLTCDKRKANAIENRYSITTRAMKKQ